MPMGKTPLKSFWLSYIVCAALMSAFTAVALLRPELFAGGGYSGPAHWRENSPAGIRFSGDSYRYISAGEQLAAGQGMVGLPRSYIGYIAVVALCLKCGLGLSGVVLVQWLAGLLGLYALMRIAWHGGGWRPALLCGGIYAGNPEFAFWHSFIMTESLYINAVCLAMLLCLWAQQRAKTPQPPGEASAARPWRQALTYAGVLVLLFLIALIRPNGWILPPIALLFWLFNASWPLRRRLLACGVVCLLFVVIALSGGNFRKRIEQEGPFAKLYSGEVVWQEDLWRVNMPAQGQYDATLGDALKYVLRHPLACCRLALKRVGVLFLRVRPGYSLAHNALLIAIYLPLLLLATIGAAMSWKEPASRLAIMIILGHALIVALTFNDNDGRFTLYFTPQLGYLAAIPLLTLWQKTEKVLRAMRQGSAQAT
ncbi:MAG: hypothetical protein ACOX9E_05045 [Lentisphaeria bacterium]|jgi:hypothetical protein